ncbi:MAG: GNAT family N-acetyltransferase [Lachnospiraceae bacterium]|nr:GNAT family N-acetyltransferase [Lachnospiraceae bacterium]
MNKTDLIEGKKLNLRRMTVNDTENIIAWRNKPFVVERFIYKMPVTADDHRKWIREKVETGIVEQFVIVVKESGQEIGSVYLQKIDHEKHSAEYGIFIGEEDALGKGYGSEAMELILKYAEERLGISTVDLRVLEDNASAMHVYEKNGFKIVEEKECFYTEDGKKIIHMMRG